MLKQLFSVTLLLTKAAAPFRGMRLFSGGITRSFSRYSLQSTFRVFAVGCCSSCGVVSSSALTGVCGRKLGETGTARIDSLSIIFGVSPGRREPDQTTREITARVLVWMLIHPRTSFEVRHLRLEDAPLVLTGYFWAWTWPRVNGNIIEVMLNNWSGNNNNFIMTLKWERFCFVFLSFGGRQKGKGWVGPQLNLKVVAKWWNWSGSNRCVDSRHDNTGYQCSIV